jgi:putative serine protease PepD
MSDSMSSRRALIAAALGPALAACLLAGCSSGTTRIPSVDASPAPAVSGSAAALSGPAEARLVTAAVQQELVSVIKRVLPSVVEIRTNAGLGSGVVLDASGDIVTNAHVVADASSFQVLSPAAVAGRGSSGTAPAPLPAALVGSCPGDDLAVIRVAAAAGLPPATFGDLAGVSVGDLVLAIGSPLGLDGSVTEGIVSAIGRSVAEPASTGSPAAVLAGTIQTSAAINPGNSGGALVNIDGAVIGIPTLAAVNRGGAAPGIGFAIPASTAVSVGRQLAGTGGASSLSAHRACRG